jgi:hypothetical protein
MDNAPRLSPIDIVAVSLTCHLFNKWTARHLIDSAALANGYPKRRSLLASFTCYCERVGWNVLYHCECFVNCSYCTRKLPERLTLTHPSNSTIYYCGFPCETHCTQCDKIMNSKNTAEFMVFRWSLRCRDHSSEFGIVWQYVWRNRRGKTIRSLFADELAVLNNGPILWDKIKEYDPHHISLQNAPNAIPQETPDCAARPI